MKRIVVTGAKGGTGVSIVDHLQQAGYDVLGVDIKPVDLTETGYVRHDLRDGGGLNDLLAGADGVIHFGSLPTADWASATETFHNVMVGGFNVFQEIIQSSNAAQPKEMVANPAVKRSAWERNTATAESFNEPGRFTALIGFEWSSIVNGNNLHRVVVFRDGADRANQVLPLPMFDSVDPEHLWEYMEGYETATHGQVLAIPHNGNWSNGIMFSLETLDGRPLDRAYAEARMRWEPIYEVTQMKGDGETHPFLSSNDEFADFEPWDKANVPATVPKEDWMYQYEYARQALRNGLAQEAKLGANPFKFGMIGSTDAHTSLATTREDNNFSKTPHMEPSNHRATEALITSPLGDQYTQFGSEIRCFQQST